MARTATAQPQVRIDDGGGRRARASLYVLFDGGGTRSLITGRNQARDLLILSNVNTNAVNR